jgi:hypothetical protein
MRHRTRPRPFKLRFLGTLLHNGNVLEMSLQGFGPQSYRNLVGWTTPGMGEMALLGWGKSGSRDDGRKG